MKPLRPTHPYIPMARGFVYLAVVLDWFSRRVLSWRVSITMEAAFCVETLEEALAKHGKPEIFNTDQGLKLTGAAFTGLLIEKAIAISPNGTRCRRHAIHFCTIPCGINGLGPIGRGIPDRDLLTALTWTQTDFDVALPPW